MGWGLVFVRGEGNKWTPNRHLLAASIDTLLGAKLPGWGCDTDALKLAIRIKFGLPVGILRGSLLKNRECLLRSVKPL